jgi:hypothetical protein
VENTGQIMWPQDRIEGLGSGPFHARCELLAEYLMGRDMSFDFDMLIYKDPQTRTETPWHQDEVRRVDRERSYSDILAAGVGFGGEVHGETD